MSKFTKYLMLLLLPVLIFVSCSKKDKTETSKKSITIKGSDTMVHLVSSLAEAYMKKYKGEQISVTGGGSGTGIAALINGTTDICASSRDMQQKEKDEASSKGINVVEKVIAYDGLVVIVHPDNPVKELTMAQIKDIFTGKVKNWKELGGPDQKITALSRESNSGTYVFFQEHVLNKENFDPSVKLMPASSAIAQSISQDKWSVGYLGLGYTKEAKVKIINVKKDENSPAVTPNHNTVLDKSYSIARPLFLIFNGEPQGFLLKFLEFTLSDEGQKIVEETGYITLK